MKLSDLITYCCVLWLCIHVRAIWHSGAGDGRCFIHGNMQYFKTLVLPAVLQRWSFKAFILFSEISSSLTESLCVRSTLKICSIHVKQKEVYCTVIYKSRFHQLGSERVLHDFDSITVKLESATITINRSPISRNE